MTEPVATPAAAGALLFRQLPDELRFRDRRDDSAPGDLESLLDGFGDLLDALRGIIDQFHADGFGDPGSDGRAIQPWAVPYLAELIGADLTAPDPSARRGELARAATWHKGKGTIAVADDMADTVAGVETVVIEGWRRTLVTARVGDAAMPGGRMPDVRRAARAVAGAGLDDPLAIITLPIRDAEGMPGTESRAYRIVNPDGIPCFPNAFDDPAARLPDMRARRPAPTLSGPHPARIAVHARPADGFFSAGLKTLAPADFGPLLAADTEGRRVMTPANVLASLAPGAPVPDRVQLKGSFAVPAGATLEIEDVNIDGTVTVPADAHLVLRRAAVRAVTLAGPSSKPTLDARDSLIGSIAGPLAFARLEYVTVLGAATLARLYASEALFADSLGGVTCGPESCLRFSRVPPPLFAGCRGTNTAAPPAFTVRVLDRSGVCTIATPEWGEPGCGVLAHDASAALTSGAEDDGEIGAFHHRFYAASLRALERRLSDALPFGLTLVIVHDARLALAPPQHGDLP